MKTKMLSKGLILSALSIGIAVAFVGLRTLSAQQANRVNPKAKEVVAPKKADNKDSLSEADKKLELARVGNVVITVGELAERIGKMSPYARGRYESVEKKKELLDSMIEFEVLAREATRRGFSKDPDVDRMLRQVMIQRLRQRVVEETIKESDVKDEEVSAYYEKNKAQYNKPEMVRASHIVVADEATARKVLAEVKAKGANPRDFRQIVQKYSTDEETKKRAGDLRYFTQDDRRVPKTVIENSFKLLKRGDVAGPIKSEKGWHVVQLTHRKEALVRKLDDPKVKEQIVSRLLRQKRRDALEEFKTALRKNAKVNIFDKELADVKIDTTFQRGPQGGPGAPGFQGFGMQPGGRNFKMPRGIGDTLGPMGRGPAGPRGGFGGPQGLRPPRGPQAPKPAGM